MQWDPSPEGLQQLVVMLRDSQAPDQATIDRIRLQLEHMEKHPEWARYLVYTLTRCDPREALVRQSAGLLLKNLVRDRSKQVGEDSLQYVKQEVVRSIGDADERVRKAVGSIVTSLVSRSGLPGWPGLLEFLGQLLGHENPLVRQGALRTLLLLCEDHSRDIQEQEGRPLNALVPLFLQLLGSQDPSFRLRALRCINFFIPDMPQAIKVNMDSILMGVFKLATDESALIQKEVCQALNLLTDIKPTFVAPHITNVIQFMLLATRHPEPDTAIVACEFWSIIAENQMFLEDLRPFLPQVMQMLLDGMVYSEEEVIDLLTDDDASIQDSAKDIQPFFAKSSRSKGEGGSAIGGRRESHQWTFRKCAAAGLETVCELYGDPVLELLFPILQQRMGDSRWNVRECSLLALGASAEGCIRGMLPVMPAMFEHLLAELSHPHPLVRSMACWTMGRVSGWVVRQPAESNYLSRLIHKLLELLMDQSKNVQEAACSAMATVEEECLLGSPNDVSLFIPFLAPALNRFMQCYRVYRSKNLLILYDVLGTLADSVGVHLAHPELLGVLMGPLTEMWGALADNDRRLIPLVETLTSIAVAIGPAFQPYALVVVQRCLGLVRSCVAAEQALEAATAAQRAGTLPPGAELPDEPDYDFCICSLDLLSGMAETFKQSAGQLLDPTDAFALVFECTKSSSYRVITSAFAFVGDMAKHGPAASYPALQQFLPALVDNLYLTDTNVCCNASWAIGELTAKIGNGIAPHVPAIMERLIKLLSRERVRHFLRDNLAITLGRLALVCTDLVASRLGDFLRPWASVVADIKWPAEKEACSRAMCLLIHKNPNASLKYLYFVVDVIASWNNPNQQLNEMFGGLLHWYKANLGAQWPHHFDQVPEHFQAFLRSRYGV